MEKYFAADTPDKAVETLVVKSKNWFSGITDTDYIDKIKRSWRAYHGQYYERGHSLSSGGEQGELVNLAVNHYRNLARHIHVMVTSTRPSFRCRAINTDRKSLIQANLGNGLLDYYMREMKLESVIKDAVEYAIVLGSGYIKLEWNSTKGKIYDYVEPEEADIIEYDEDGEPLDKDGIVLKPFPIYEGDVDFKLMSPFDVVFDSTKENYKENDWVLCRTFVNKFDLAAKYPELAEKILAQKTKDQLEKSSRRVFGHHINETTDIPVYEFFHNRTESMPNGRYMMYVDEESILEDAVMPYRSLPIYRITPSHILGTPYGYTDMFDLLPLQDMLNSLYSTAATNINAFGVQNILNPRGNDVMIEQVAEGMNFIEYNAQMGKPEALNLVQTSPEVYQMMQLLEKSMETLSGVNAVARGNPEQSLRSGNALALVQSQALQFVSGLQQSYIQLLEDVGTGLINLLKDFANVPRIAAISGLNNSTEMREFKSDDIKSINRVVVDVGNALMQCLAKDTEVLMYDGSIKLSQDIRNGDLVMGPDSKPRTVTQAGSGFEEMFEIRTKNTKDELVYTCNKSHIMTLKYCSDYKDNKKGDQLDISVSDYLELTEKEKSILMGFRTDVEFEKKDVELNPYAFGLWLGDGNSDRLTITSDDDILLSYWKETANSMGYNWYESKMDNRTAQVGFGKTEGKVHSNILKELEVYNNKHIPYVYKYNDQESLLNFLAGFIDADGTLVDQTFVIEQKDANIAKDVQFIARSLGFKATLKTIKKNTNYSSKETEHSVITIGGDTWRIPTKLERKQSQEVKKQKDWRNYGISLTSIGHDTYYGFTLEEEPHFLLGDFTVTHNTTAGRAQVAENLLQMGLIESPEKYLMVMNTGNLDYLTEGKMDEMMTIKGENEAMVRGEEVIAIFSDHHALHIKEHRDVLADYTLRRDPELVQEVLDHIQEHITLLQTTDPNILAICGENPLAPPGGAPINPGQPNVPTQGGPAQAMDPNMGQPGMPKQPRPAGEGDILPEQPTTPQELLDRNTKG